MSLQLLEQRYEEARRELLEYLEDDPDLKNRSIAKGKLAMLAHFRQVSAEDWATKLDPEDEKSEFGKVYRAATLLHIARKQGLGAAVLYKLSN